MVDWVTIPDANLEPDKPGRTVDAIALRDNPIHLHENFIGCVIWHAASTPPARTLECDGSAVSRTTYAQLFAKIGTTFGAGDGSTTFALPDLRGEFVRGWDHGRGVDSGRAFGSFQAHAFTSHVHAESVAHAWSTGSDAVHGEALGASGDRVAVASNTGAPSAGAGSETRPRNRALLPCIVYKGTGA